MTLLRGVTQHGTGAAAAQLNHPIGGKTGTTSDFTDAWFLGFSPSVTCGVWVGFDSRESLGEKETGARAALPIWMTFMRAAIAAKPNEQFAGDDESDHLLKAQVVPPTTAQPQVAAQPKQTAGTPARTMPGAASPAKAVVGVKATPVAKLTEATGAVSRMQPAVGAEPAATNQRGTLKPAVATPR
jgi:penicillin-binding protein 1A